MGYDITNKQKHPEHLYFGFLWFYVVSETPLEHRPSPEFPTPLIAHQGQICAEIESCATGEQSGTSTPSSTQAICREQRSGCSFLLQIKPRTTWSPSTSASMQMHKAINSLPLYHVNLLASLKLSVLLKTPPTTWTITESLTERDQRKSFDMSLGVHWQEGREETKCWIASVFPGSTAFLHSITNVFPQLCETTATTLSCALTHLTIYSTAQTFLLTTQSAWFCKSFILAL